MPVSIVDLRVQLKPPTRPPRLLFINNESENFGYGTPGRPKPGVTAKETIVPVDPDHTTVSLPIRNKVRNVNARLVEETKDGETDKIPHHRSPQDLELFATRTDREPTTETSETPNQHLPLLTRKLRTLRQDVHDGLHGREIDIISSGLVVATNNILTLPEITENGLEVLLSNIPTDTPAERADVIVKSVVHRRKRTFDVRRLHRYDSMLPLRLSYA
jgi:hypothetical protein